MSDMGRGGPVWPPVPCVDYENETGAMPTLAWACLSNGNEVNAYE